MTTPRPGGRPRIGQPLLVRIPDHLKTDLHNYAHREGVSASQIIREALALYLHKMKATTPTT